ncbi:energy transducer TonB [Gammaproteobacteria bacterium]|nr:energy transducer TonB [Gammaproteobacteria bacterium]
MSIHKNKNFILSTLSILLLSACGPSQEEIAEQERLAEEAKVAELKRRSDLATVTCNFMAESRNMDAAMRIKEINSVRERLGEDFYLGTDAGIKESFEYGLCRELVLNDPDYNSKLLETITAAKEAEEKARIASEKLAEEKFLAWAEKKAEEERIARVKKAEEERIARVKKAEEERMKKEKELEIANRLIEEVTPIYPRRAKERGTQGYSLVKFTISESGTVEDVIVVEGYCGDPTNPETVFRPCSIFNSSSSRAALKLKYKSKVVNGKAVSTEDVLHRFTFVMADDN